MQYSYAIIYMQSAVIVYTYRAYMEAFHYNTVAETPQRVLLTNEMPANITELVDYVPFDGAGGEFIVISSNGSVQAA